LPEEISTLPRAPRPEAVDRLLEHCGRFSPILGREPTDPQSLLLDITGLAHLFDGEPALAGEMVSDFRRLGMNIRLALADTIGAAWAAAKYAFVPSAFPLPARLSSPKSPSPFVLLPPGQSPAFLRPLPTEALRLPEETVRLLAELGIFRIGQLEALPRDELLSRFGPLLAGRMDQAFGRLDEPVRACPLPPHFAVDWSAEHPISRREMIEAAVEHLVGRTAALLAAGNRGALQLECRLECLPSQAAQQTIRLSIGLFRPTAAAAHLFQLAQLQLERLRIPAPVTGVRVQATLTAPLEPRRQAVLFDFGDEGASVPLRQLAALVERLSSRLGPGAVLGVRLRPEAQPELSWHYDPLLERGQRRRGRQAEAPADLPPRPLRLLPRPIVLAVTQLCGASVSANSAAATAAPPIIYGPPLWFHFAGQQHHVAQVWGPERIETGWWRGRPVGRDYFRVETIAGRRFWLFRRLRDEKWFLQGMFE
jgi:protein ImuB